jgi:LacI family gluconate utilization system Gnt-I transcriptional repressor
MSSHPSQRRFARMADVASMVGVTKMTVSRALHHPSKVAPETLRRIGEAIEQTGYVSNVLAGSLASNRTQVIAALIPTVQHAIFADTVSGLSDALGPHGYQLMLGNTGYRRTEEDAFIEAFLSRRVDGIMLTGVTHSKLSRDRLSRAGLPTVETWDIAENPIDMVIGYSNERAAYSMTCRLAALGYRTIAFVSGPSRTNERARRREMGYLKAVEHLGLQALPILRIGEPAAPRIADGASALIRLLRPGSKPDAVFFTSDIYAVGAIQEAQKRGLIIPEELGIAGFHDLEIGHVVRPALTTVHVPAYEIGHHAGLSILARLAGRPVDRILEIPFRIVERGSTRLQLSATL